VKTEWVARFDAGDIAMACLAILSVFAFYLPGLVMMFGGLSKIGRLDRLANSGFRLAGLLALSWFVWGYSLAFAPSWGTVPVTNPDQAQPVHSDLREAMAAMHAREDLRAIIGRGGWIGGGRHFLLQNLTPAGSGEQVLYPTRRSAPRTPHVLYVIYQLAVCLAMTAPLMILLLTHIAWRGAVLFALFWSAVVYAPVAHSIWGEGWLAMLGAVDHGGSLLHLACAGAGWTVAWLLSRNAGLPAISASWTTNGEESSEPPGGETPGIAARGALLLAIGTPFSLSSLALDANGAFGGAWCNVWIAALTAMASWATTARFLGRPADPDAWPLGFFAGTMMVLSGAGMIAFQTAFLYGVVAGALGAMLFGGAASGSPLGRASRFFAVQITFSILGLVLCGVFAVSTLGGRHIPGQMISGLIESGDSSLLQRQAMASLAALAWSVAVSALLLVACRKIAGNGPAHVGASESGPRSC
jgi:Amt family ammonium transporter